MFETAELDRTIDKKTYKKAVPELRARLLELQAQLRERADFPVIVVIGGVDGAGKGPTVNRLHEWMDPRYLQTHAFGPCSDEERERPDFWRFWRLLPPTGRIGIFFGSWYTQPIVDHVAGETDEHDLETELVRIREFERALTSDGALIVKFWFHLSKERQKERLEALEQDPENRWRVGPDDWKHFRHYDDFYAVCTRALRETSTGEAPWTIVEGYDDRYREITVGEHLAEAIAARLANGKPPVLGGEQIGARPERTILETVDLSAKVKKKVYQSELKDLQGWLNRLSRRATPQQLSTVLVFEGWDAAGKGGVIRRITSALDARFYQVIPIAAPTDEEQSHHYLWRFWRHLPRAGRTTIYDRSWYGRILVERVEELASAAEWMRAYREINAFEEQLHEHGALILKFWLHISPEEQLRRFEEREQIAYKRFKITEEDYRNRERRPDYEWAVNDMVQRTSTEYAPWHLISSEDKRHARLTVLRTICEELEARL